MPTATPQARINDPADHSDRQRPVEKLRFSVPDNRGQADAQGRVLGKFYGAKEWDSPESLEAIAKAFRIKM